MHAKHNALNVVRHTVCSTYTLEHHTAMNKNKATHMAQTGNQRLGRTQELALGRCQVLDSGAACSGQWAWSQ